MLEQSALGHAGIEFGGQLGYNAAFKYISHLHAYKEKESA